MLCRSLWIVLTYILLIGNASASASEIAVTYIGNEGFLIAAGDKKILIDALYRDGVPGYVVIPEQTRKKLEQASPPFDGVDLLLATHHHADHFDAQAVANHLENSPGAMFVSTEQAVAKLEKLPNWNRIQERVRKVKPAEGERIQVEWAGIDVSTLSLHHGREVPVQNLGFLVSLGNKKILHIGDTVANEEEFKVNHLVQEKIDIAFIPFWYLTEPDSKKAIPNAIHPRQIVVMHVPPPDAKDEYIEKLGGWQEMLKQINKDFPESFVFREVMTTKQFP